MSPGARRALERVPTRAGPAIIEFITGALLVNPHRVGRPLRRELAGQYVARRGAYRVVYRIDESRGVVRVLRIDHRSAVYRSR